MSNIPWVAAWALVGLGLGAGEIRAGAAAEDGVALAVVYDTSGSMNEPVRDGAGKQAPKHVIAQRALQSVVQRLQAFVASAPADAPRRLHAGLYVFSAGEVKEFTKLGPFDPKAIAEWTRDLPAPSGGTPLGNALQAASEAVLQSPLSRKHVLVVTDGMNTVGPDPAARVARAEAKAAERKRPVCPCISSPLTWTPRCSSR